MTNHFKRYFLIYLVALLLAGGLARSVEIRHDLPGIYHSDTAKRVLVLDRQVKSGEIRMEGGDPVGYVQAAYYQRAVRDWLRSWMGLEPLPTSLDALFLEVRFTVWALGLMGLLFVCLAGYRAYGPALGVLAGLIYMLDELALIHSHYAMGDLAQAGFVVGALYYSLRVLDRNSLADSIAAGLMAGAAAACKYYGGYMIAVFVLAHLMSHRKHWVGLPLGLVAGAVGFTALTPALFLDFKGFLFALHGMLAKQALHNPVESGAFLSNMLAGLVDIWSYWWRFDLLSALLLPLAVILLIWRHRRADVLLLVSILGAVAILTAVRGKYLRDWDMAILGPLAALAVAGGFQAAWGLLGPQKVLPEKRWWQPGRWWRRPVVAGVLAALVLFQAWNTGELVTVFNLPDTRQQAAGWAAKRLPPAPPESPNFVLDGFLPTAGKTYTAANLMPEDRGYNYIFGPLRKWRPGEPGGWKELVSGRNPAYALLWGLWGRATGRYSLDWVSGSGEVVKKFTLSPFSWFNPDIYLAALADRRLTAPLILPSIRPAGLERISQARTPYGRREVREAVLQHDPALLARVSLVSDRPVERMGLVLSGRGSFTLWQAFRRWDAKVEPGRDSLVCFSPLRGWPWLQGGRFHNLLLRGEHGPILARLIIRAPELAMALEDQGRPEQALEIWGLAVENGGNMLPRERLACAAALKRAGHQEAAQKVLDPLNQQYPDLRAALDEVRELVSTDPAGAVAALARGLKVSPDLLTWQREIIPLPPENQGRPDWWQRPLGLVSPQADDKEVELPGWFVGPHLTARLWVMTRGAGEAAGRVVLGTADEPRKSLAWADLPSRPGEGYFPVEMRFTLDRKPARLSLKLENQAGGEVYALALEVRNDIAAWAAATWPRY